MGFNKVYKVLVEVFPEVDCRALRAVAIEHQKDADAAVEVVLTEVIPFLTERSTTSISSSKNVLTPQPPNATVIFADGTPSSSNVVPAVNVKCPPSPSSVAPIDEVIYPVSPSNVVPVDSVRHQEEELHVPFHDVNADQPFHDAKDGLDELDQERKLDKLVNEYDGKSGTVDSGAHSCTSSVVLVHENGANAGTDEVFGDHACDEGSALEVSQGLNSINGDELSQLNVKPLKDGNVHHSQGLDNSLDHEASHAEKFEDENSLFKDELSQITSPSDILSDLNKEFDGPVDTVLVTESSIDLVDVASDSGLSTVVTRSGQICRTDLVDNSIADVRNYKEPLLSALETILDFGKELEERGEAAEKAKEDATNSGLDIFKRAEDIKQMLQHATEANAMHAGEVYGERAILATEVRELQTRLLRMSDERDRHLQMYEEMRQNLEARLVEAEDVIKAAEKKKVEREDAARKALKDQEILMEKVVQEANLLKQEAEENAKLQEFLMDRGRVVDALQGEMSLICTDLRLLKEKIDARLPFSKSLIPRYTQRYGLASSFSSAGAGLASSSSSAANSVISGEQGDLVANRSDVSETLKVLHDNSGSEDQFVGEDETTDVFKDVDKELAGDGWEIFDNLDTYM